MTSRLFNRSKCIRLPLAILAADWRASSQGLAALRDFGPADRRFGSIVRITAPQHRCLLHPS